MSDHELLSVIHEEDRHLIDAISKLQRAISTSDEPSGRVYYVMRKLNDMSDELNRVGEEIAKTLEAK